MSFEIAATTRRPAEMAPGHGLFGAPNFRRISGGAGYPVLRTQDEADLFNAGEAGHERIEYDALRPLVRDQRVIAAIYFGNWQRDMSQLLAPVIQQKLGEWARLVCDLIFEVVDVLSEAKFNRRLDRSRFGTYRWEEHIDNPRDFGIALVPSTCSQVSPALRNSRPEYQPEAAQWGLSLWREGPDATPRYIQTSREYVLRELGSALQRGPNVAGLEHFGNAMHTVEDFYAHSNFIELCFNRLYGDDPLTGRDAQTGQLLRDSRGRYRLTTGVFLFADTLSSLNRLFLQHLETPPGAQPSPVGNRVIRVLVRRLLGSQAVQAYDGFLRAWEATGIPAIIGNLQLAVERAIFYPLRRAVAELLRPLAEAAVQQTGRTSFRMPLGSPIRLVREISHSQLAKDDSHHIHHGVARQLAIRAVQDFWRQMEAAWNRGQVPRFADLVQVYMSHPLAAGNWWMPMVTGRPISTSIPSPQALPGSPASRAVEVLDGFPFQSSSLSVQHAAVLDRIARRIVASHRSVVVRLVGHADSTGPAPYNQRLGLTRTQTAGQALTRRLDALRPGLSRTVRFLVSSRGETQPVADNRTPQGRARNRRVEIYVEPGPPGASTSAR